MVVVAQEKGVPVNDAIVVTEKHLMKCKEGCQTPSGYVMIAESLMSGRCNFLEAHFSALYSCRLA